ncbi:MAG: hypothetical protein IIZ78_24100 [Clostridiales bacterium]|nr:hypothetical protein [Clostridiales bacterium]
MISAFRTEGTDLKGKFEFMGLSTDEKPTETYEGTEIMNGSSFFEMDNQAVKFYDEASKNWV